MYPVLILRSELVCLVILIFLLFTSRAYNLDNESKAFKRILFFAILHVVFDIVTVLTVNHTDVVPLWVNWICHVLFYLSAIFFSNEIVNYVVAICYPRQARKLYATGHILTALYICALPFMEIEYVADLGTYSSSGMAAYVGYGLAFLFFIAALVIIFTHMGKLSVTFKSTLIPMMLVLMCTEIGQIICRSVLFTGGAITIVTVGFFFSLENPVEVFKKKAQTDALTGVRSRNSYEEDIEKYDKSFSQNPSEDYIFAFFDINDLRNVNNQFGHAEGDNYISLVASAIKRSMKNATSVYRIGGDEFLILYYQTNEDIVEKEIVELQKECAKASESLLYIAGVSTGYARSSESYKSLRDVVRTADYAMYQNKAAIKSGQDQNGTVFGTKLNYTGLTDKIFDVMCASNNRSYPFITNLETNVTRIAPGWKEFFGLDSEFYMDFLSVWKDRIQPDYFDGYIADVTATINGHQKYHSFDYLAKKTDGEYVKVSCHGSVYKDNETGSAFFTGFIVNHGMDDHLDAVTGHRDIDSLVAAVCRCMDEEKPFSVMKLTIINYARVNMLYGYSGGSEVVKKLAEILTGEISGRGEVFSSGADFSILFETDSESELEKFYRTVSEICADGLSLEAGMVPILLSGGAITNSGERIEIEKMRRGLVFAVEESHYYRRNKLVFYHEFDEKSENSDISLLSKIHADALSGMRGFKLRYQPIMDVASGKIIGAEALLRWSHSDYGEVSPGKFIDFIENDPCYYRLGLGILDQAVRDAKQLRDKIPEFRMNVNITALQLQNDDFVDHVIGVLNKYEYPPEGLMLELTERCKEMDSAFLAKRISDIRSRGVLVAFDDLGTGYSTISLLMDIPVDEIKLDRGFVGDIENRENYQLFVKALVRGSASDGNNYSICFEGIENENMLNLVKRFGDFLAQGYYFAEPLLISDFNDYVVKKSEHGSDEKQ